MAIIDKELAAAKEAGVTVEQVQAITAEAIKRQTEPIDQSGFWENTGFGDYRCRLCKMPSPPSNLLAPGRTEVMEQHRAWHNQLEVRLRKLEQGARQ